tara:strand:+ start:43898 stop:44047 length:150 start_codon:yes stop_codon:yes gene_type:complete
MFLFSNVAFQGCLKYKTKFAILLEALENGLTIYIDELIPDHKNGESLTF